MGVITYDTFVDDLHAEYRGSDGYTVKSEPKTSSIAVNDKVNKSNFAQNLKEHQQGNTDFTVFREDAARSGVFKRTMDMQTMTCSYYDKNDNIILAETLQQ